MKYTAHYYSSTVYQHNRLINFSLKHIEIWPLPHPVPLSSFKHPALFSPPGWRGEERGQGWRGRLGSHQEIGGEPGEDCALLCGREAQLSSAFLVGSRDSFDDGCSAVVILLFS